MSRMYRIAVSEEVSRVVHVEDGVETTLDILPVLPQEQLQGLLAGELAKRGFSRVEDSKTMVRAESDGTLVEVDTETGTVNVSIAEEVAVRGSASTEIVGDEDYGLPDDARREAAKQGLREGIEKDLDRKGERERERVTKKLEEKLGALRKELDGVVNGVTAEGLKIRARQIGEVESVEDKGDGELTIRVKV